MSKKLIPIQIKLRVWDGTLDHSWYTNSVDGIAHISTPEQFADFITPTSSRSGITEVHLDNDLYFNENYLENKTWTVDTQNNSIVNTAVQSNRQLFTLTNDLTFYGHLHSIYGFSWKATANSENHFIFLQGQSLNLTFKDLYWRNCYFTEAAGAGFIMGVEYNSTYGCHFQNVEFIDTYFDYRGANSWGVWNTSILTRTSRSSIVFNGCQFRNVTCIAQRGGQSGNFDDNYEYNIILKDCTSTTTNFNQIFYNGQTTKQLAYSYGNTSIVNNKTSYEELIDSFNSYESSTMELVDVEEDFTFENTPEPTDEHYEEPFVKPLSIPEGSDFLWRAKEYDASTNSIRNLVENSYFGTLNIMNTPTFVDGEKKYLNFTNVNQYLYHSLDSQSQANMIGNGDNHYYTIIFKAYYSTKRTGILLNLTKNKTSYFNMLWSNNNNGCLEVSLGDNSSVISNVQSLQKYYFKYERTNTNVTLTCLDTLETNIYSVSGTQYIDDEIRFMSHGGSWSLWERFYGVYGIPRKLTDKETQDVIRLLDGEDPHDESPIHCQPKTEVDEPKFNVWDGVTYDGSWWNASSSILNIDTAAQVADFFRNSNGYKLDGKTVNFNNNFYMNLNYKDCHNWTDTSNDFYWIKPNNHSLNTDNNNTETIIDGKCHTIYGLAICDYSTSERGAIMNFNNIATIKDLRFDGLWSWERKSYGRLFKFYYGRAKIYNVVLCNSNIVDYGFSSYKASVVNFGDYSKGNNEVNMVLYNNKLNLTTSPGFMGRAVYGTNVKYNVCAYSNIAVNTGILFPVSQLTIDSGSNYEYYDMGGFTNSGTSCDSVESLIDSYNSNHVFSDERELYIDEDNNPTFWDESHEQITPSDYVYEDERVGQVTNILKDQTFPYTQQADYRDTYTWALYGRTVNSSTTGIEWTIAKPCTITFECWQSSEANYDYGHIDKNGSEIKSWRGQGATHSTYEASFVAGDKLRLRYTKDGSVSSGDDTFYCKMMIDGLGIDEHGDCFVGTTVRHWYKLGEKKLLLINKKDIGE